VKKYSCDLIVIFVWLIVTSVAVADQQQVSIGAGSIASEPPSGNKSAAELWSRLPRVAIESEGKPLPTNDWWTDLLWSQPFPGKLWAYPLTISANAEGLLIWYPRNWTDNGQELRLGEPLRVRGVLTTPIPETETVLFDFESKDALRGWKRDGDAVNTKPDNFNGTTGVIGKQFISSFTNGDAGTGLVTSPPFTIDRNYLHMRVAGGDDSERLGVKLLVDEKSVFHALGEKSNRLKWHSFDVSAWVGREARLQVIDQSQGGWGFTALDHVVLSDKYETPSGGVFKYASTVRWGDWSVTMRLHAAAGEYMDVTFGRGMPSVWIEPSAGLDIRVRDWEHNSEGSSDFGSVAHLLPGDRNFAQFFGKNKKTQQRYLSISALPSIKNMDDFERYAHAIPRDTRFSWKYSPKHGKVVTIWEVDTEVMGGSESRILQGWIPHHYRRTLNDLEFNDIEYTSRRGRLRLAPGNTFRIARDFNGIVPALPLPQNDVDFKPERLAAHLNYYAEELLKKPVASRHGGDTYWGGKSMLKNVNTSILARLINHPRAGEIEQAAREIVVNWLTYSPGEKERYYAQYKAPWNGIVGFNSSYGSEKFTDNHFHYGYLVYSAAILAMRDASFREGYSELITKIARQYANWERDHPEFPYLRTFEPWVGHSYAGGLSSHSDGNNQESSSEAMQSWVGLFLLGSVLGDDDMRDCGAMGYAVESEAVQEYWNDTYGWNDPEAANYPEIYKPTIVSVVRDRDIGAWTWFSGDPLHIYGIQWLPNWSTMHYLGRHPEHAAWQFKQMLLKKGKGSPLPYDRLDADWGHVALGYYAWSRPVEACKILDDAYANNWPLASHRNAGHNYYLAHAYRALGEVNWSMHTDLPTSLVFLKDGVQTVVAWNAGVESQKVTVYKGRQKVSTFTAESQGLTRYTLP